MLEKSFSCRSFLHKIDTGVLSTQMDFEGEIYPYGSICPYVMTPSGDIIILISEIARHTKNIHSNQNVSFTVYDQDADNKQQAARCSIMAKAKVIQEESEGALAKDLYTKFFPESKRYFEAHDFSFYKLSPVRVRYIQGFGKINWIEAKDFGPVLPKWWDNKQGIIDHMNDDHKSALKKYQESLIGVEGEVELFDVSVEGFHLKIDSKLFFIAFSKPCIEEQSVREEFIWLLRSLD
jgi:putative heme iron utilization protein